MGHIRLYSCDTLRGCLFQKNLTKKTQKFTEIPQPLRKALATGNEPIMTGTLLTLDKILYILLNLTQVT